MEIASPLGAVDPTVTAMSRIPALPSRSAPAQSPPALDPGVSLRSRLGPVASAAHSEALSRRLQGVADDLEVRGRSARASYATMTWFGAGRAELEHRLDEMDARLAEIVEDLRERARSIVAATDGVTR